MYMASAAPATRPAPRAPSTPRRSSSRKLAALTGGFSSSLRGAFSPRARQSAPQTMCAPLQAVPTVFAQRSSLPVVPKVSATPAPPPLVMPAPPPSGVSLAWSPDVASCIPPAGSRSGSPPTVEVHTSARSPRQSPSPPVVELPHARQADVETDELSCTTHAIPVAQSAEEKVIQLVRLQSFDGSFPPSAPL
jgi:hypothetical protein